jgi:hypothetical protein
MRRLLSILAGLGSLTFLALAQPLETRVRQLELQGDPLGAQALLEQAIEEQPQNLDHLLSYAEFLDRRSNPKAREIYAKLLERLSGPGDGERKAQVARRLVILDLLAGDQQAAARHLEAYRAAGGRALGTGSIPRPAGKAPEHYIEIPGPLSAFARMIAITPELEPENVLPAIARNVVTSGYQASASYEGLQQTEYLKLAIRYLSQARELEKLADEQKVIRIETCDSPQTAELLRVLGYRMRGGCGSEVILETVNATRAFLTIDSGFPLAELEQALRTNRPFVHDFKPSRVPILYGEDYWLSAQEKKRGEPFINVFLGDPSLCRLYLGLSKLSPETSAAMRKAADVQRLKAFAHVLDFFGSLFEVRDGRAVVPGGNRTAAMWEKLVGVSPNDPGEFFVRLIAKDDGWMASYFDSLLRINGPTLDYLTEPQRMERFYMAIRGRVTSPGPARPVFRSNADLMLLVSRLRLDADGRPHVPGGLEIWKRLFMEQPEKEFDRRLKQAAPNWKEPDDLIEALFALCRKPVGNQPLKVYLALSDINRVRTQPLAPATADRLARAYNRLGAQYTIFTESGALSDQTILTYLDRAEEIDRIGNRMLRADVAGSMQALVALWQIAVRNGAIPAAEADRALAAILDKFAKVRNHQELFASAVDGLEVIFRATNSPANLSPQDRVLDLLAGTGKASDDEAHQKLLEEMMGFFESQKLVPLDVIFDVARHLDALAEGRAQLDTALINRLESRLTEVNLPYEGLSTVEKSGMSFGYWAQRHVENQRRMKLRAEIQKAGRDADSLRGLKADLAPILRDTLVGLVYIHYAPPGAQVLRTNPLFVRAHDFLGMPGSNQTWQLTEVFGTGWPSNAGGRLVGSLCGLPYALAEAEQNFLVPDREQALIWADLVPQMILSAKVPRWWNVSAAQLHWLGLHMRFAESALAESVLNPETRRKVIEQIAQQATPARVSKVAALLEQGNVPEALENVTPSELFLLAHHLIRHTEVEPDAITREIRRLAAERPQEVSDEAISRAFGSPKPTLATSYRPELLHMRTFPTLMGYSSRIMAESWESNLLYYAALADELYLRPSQLNVVVPQWTQRTVEKIFATHLEDWPAVLRSLRQVGNDVRVEMRRRTEATQQASLE